MGNVLISSSAFPEGACYGLTQSSWYGLVALLSGQFNRDGTGINFGNSVPATIDEDKPWFRTNADGTPDKWYAHTSGLWLSRHPDFPGKVVMYEGTEASVETLDGGEAGAAAPYTGQMWEIVSEMEGRSPIGPGELTPSATVLTVGTDAGADEHELTSTELASHSHDIIAYAGGQLSGTDEGWLIGRVNTAAANDTLGAFERTGFTEPNLATGTDPDPVSILHPVRAIWFIRRTARLYYRI